MLLSVAPDAAWLECSSNVHALRAPKRLYTFQPSNSSGERKPYPAQIRALSGSKVIFKREPVAAAKRSSVRVEGLDPPLSSRAITA